MSKIDRHAMKNFLLIFWIFSTFASVVSAYSQDWIDKLEVEIYNQESIVRKEIEDTSFEDYIIYYNIYFNKGMVKTQTFTWDEPIQYLTDREILQDDLIVSFKEDVYRDSDGDGLYDNGKMTVNVDENNRKNIEPRLMLWPWNLWVTCNDIVGELWEWDYRVEHTIWVNLEYWIVKADTFYTYIICE